MQILLAAAKWLVAVVRRPSLATLMVGIGIFVGAAQIFALIWIGDSTYLRTETERHTSETNRLAIVMANGMSDRLRNVEHMTRRVIRSVPDYIHDNRIDPGILDLALDDIQAYAQANEIGIGLFEQISGGDFVMTQYRGSADYKILFTSETGSIRQLITTAEISNHTEASVAQAVIALSNPAHEEAKKEREKRKILFALTATPVLKSIDPAHPDVQNPKTQVFFVSLAILYPAHPEQGPESGCIFSVCEAALRAETGAKWNFITTPLIDQKGETITASAPIWPLPMDVVITTHVTSLSSGFPSLRYRIIAIALLTAATIVFLFTAAVHFLVRRPMGRLMLGLSQFVGDTTVRLPKIRLSEFSRTYAGFNSMADKVEEYQSELKTRAEHWRKLLDDNTTILFLIDADTGNITFANKSAVSFYGHSSDFLTGKNFSELGNAELEEQISYDKPATKRLTHSTASSEKIVDVSFGPTIIDGKNTVLAIVTDATAEMESRAEAKKADRARIETLEERITGLNEMVARERSLISTISHEILNPMAIISGAVDNIAFVVGEDDKMKRRTDSIKRAVERIDDLVKRGLASGRKQSGLSSTAKIETFDIGNIVSKITTVWVDADPSHDYTVNISNEPMPAEIDSMLIQSVFDNVIHNASKYSPAKTPIEITLTRQAVKGTANAIITVKDSGIGIPEDFIPKIGERLQRADNTGSIPGNGQGLHLCKEIVVLHGGTIDFDSQVGVGTTVRISIPLAADKNTQRRQKQQIEPPHGIAV